MIDLKPIIERIQSQLDEDTDQSVTYAALEARMALEKVCYDRLRQRHDYISHAQLKRWQPGGVVKTLMEQVDPHVTNTRTLKMSRTPHVEGVQPDDDDFVEIGTEVGFNARKIASMWQALSNLALHVRLPEHKNDHIPAYGDKVAIREKVEQVIEELQRLATTTMTFSGIGKEVKFDCDCGTLNKRRADLLTVGQSVYCINPECPASWKVEKEGDDFWFAPEEVFVECIHCAHQNRFHLRKVIDMEKNEVASFNCSKCGEKNWMRWQLCQARLPDGNEQTDATEG
ncbi:hypothetical protein NOLU111490_17305 [Novosphingobium lubricantis]|jgi:predicted RNA-binding Zn-ribbon protein involved in translation (DUF1610 family)